MNNFRPRLFITFQQVHVVLKIHQYLVEDDQIRTADGLWDRKPPATATVRPTKYFYRPIPASF